MARLFALVIVASLALASTARAQSGSCGDCHLATPEGPAREHVADWERSSHGRAAIGCQSCHGGNPASYDAGLAHRDVRNSGDPRSLAHRRHLPSTCGRCHVGAFVNFQKSRHFELLQRGDDRAPTCTTCHEAVGAVRPSPQGLEAECARCHGPRGIAPRSERATDARALLESIGESRARLRTARPLIARIKDPARQAALRDAYVQAEVPLIEAGRSMHEFVFDNLTERLGTARRRIDALMGELANPRGTGAEQ